MSNTQRQEQTEWLNLVETAGPFLAGSVLRDVFPQGLEKIETPRRQRLRAAYEEWIEAIDEDDDQLRELHAAWVWMVLEEALEFDDEVLISGDALPSYSPDNHDTVLTPDHVLRPDEGSDLIFISVYEPGVELDQPVDKDWVVSPIDRMKLLCRSHKVRVGLVTNGEQWALINAPVDNTTGHTIWYARLWWQEPVTFKAFVSLLGVRRFFGPSEDRIDQLLERSLKEHYEVTDTLGEQVRRAVEVLVQSLGRADEDRNGELLEDVRPAELYNAGLTIMMRLVVLLCAEERELLLLGDPVYDQHYAISTLHAKLREDADNYGLEVLERRYDAWSRLLSMFRAVYGGVEHESLRLPAMGGSLFDPDLYPFLEGRAKGTIWKVDPASPLPIDNRTVMLLLRALQVIEQKSGARRLSYRGLDVEQIGHVYEGLLEHKVERVSALTLGLIGSKKVPRPTISLDGLREMVEESPSKAAAKLAKLTGRSKSAMTKAIKSGPDLTKLPPLVSACGGNEALATAILPFASLLQVDSWGMPLVYQAGSFAITLGEGRRESGSHYTPKSLTTPIVETTLRPVLKAMGEQPSTNKLLDLKICDPAMGSGAFLVEVCRQLAGHVVEAWFRAEEAGQFITCDGVVVDRLGDDERLPMELSERLITARRLVAERCLYGVDKNPMAVELAKLSLWLVTLAKGRPFGFLDHKLKHGDSLVGLAKQQILSFTWEKEKPQQLSWLEQHLEKDLKEAFGWRDAIQDFGEFDYSEKKEVFEESESKLADVRLIGDLAVAAFFGAEKYKARKELRSRYLNKVEEWRTNPANQYELENIVEEFRGREKPVTPIHWEIEFPEVFGRDNPGFDAMVGNPPFLGGKKISGAFGCEYRDWLTTAHPGASSNADLVSHFFRSVFDKICQSGAAGLIATNTIAQGQTREAGLGWICTNGGEIIDARRRVKWPGAAAVTVAVVTFLRGTHSEQRILDGKAVKTITAFLLNMGGHSRPASLAKNHGFAFVGTLVLGIGFTFDDSKPEATTLKEMQALVEQAPRNAARIRPYIGGEEINNDPQHAFRRYIIDFDDLSLEEARCWPDLLQIVEAKVKPMRMTKSGSYKSKWWLFGRRSVEARLRAKSMERVLACSSVSSHLALAFIPSNIVVSHNVTVLLLEEWSAFCVLQSRVNEAWVRLTSSTLEDRLGYRPSDSFDTFPWPVNELSLPVLRTAGKVYYEFRADLMSRNDEGLTKTYNRFHDPNNNEPEIVKLRELHAAMDRAVLDAYGWHGISTDCEFLLDYEIDEETWGKKKKPYRYRWPNAVHDDVLARLLELNRKRHAEEVETGLHNKKGEVKVAPKRSQTSDDLTNGQEDLFR